jgi:hypothetical protein
VDRLRAIPLALLLTALLVVGGPVVRAATCAPISAPACCCDDCGTLAPCCDVAPAVPEPVQAVIGGEWSPSDLPAITSRLPQQPVANHPAVHRVAHPIHRSSTLVGLRCQLNC